MTMSYRHGPEHAGLLPTPAQLFVAQEVANGRTAGQIARAHNLTRSAVANRLQALRVRLGVQSTTHAIALLVASGHIAVWLHRPQGNPP